MAVINGVLLRPLGTFSNKKKSKLDMERYLKHLNQNKLELANLFFEVNKDKHIPSKNIRFLETLFVSTNFTGDVGNMLMSEILKLSVETLNEASIDISYYIDESIKMLTENEKDVLERRYNGQTLNEIGQIYNLTRERIRQVESKSARRLGYLIRRIKYEFVTDEDVLETTFVDDEEEQNVAILLKVLNMDKGLISIRKHGKLIIKEAYNATILSVALGEMSSSDIIHQHNIEEALDFLSTKSIRYVDKFDIESMLMKRKFRRVNDSFVSTRKVVTPYLYLIEKYFKQGITLHQMKFSDDHLLLNKYMSQFFPDIEISSNPRSINARLMSELYAIDRSKYIPKNNLDFNIDLIQPILDYIHDSERSTFFFSELFSIFRENLLDNGVVNHYMLRTWLSIACGEAFNFSRDSLRKLGLPRVGLSDQVSKYLEDSNRIVSISEIKEKFKHFPEAHLSLSLFNSNNIIGWRFSEYIHLMYVPKLMNSEEIVLGLKQVFLCDDFVYSEAFFNMFEFENVNMRFTPTLDNIGAYIKIYFSNYVELVDNVVWKKGSAPKLLFDRLKIYFSLKNYATITDDNILALNKLNKMNTSNIAAINKVMTSNFIRKDKHSFHNTDISLSTSSVEDIYNEISIKLNSEIFVTPSDILKNCPLPLVGFTWTEESIGSVVNLYLHDRFKYITSYQYNNNDRFGVIVKGLDYKSVDEVIAAYLDDLDVETITESELRKFLLNSQVINKSIPIAFYEGEYFEYLENEGKFIVKYSR